MTVPSDARCFTREGRFRSVRLLAAVPVIACHSACTAHRPQRWGVRPPGDAGLALVDLATMDPRILIELRYATTDNFTGQKLYPVERCMLREPVARRLRRVQDRLAARSLGLKIYDAYRPLSVQRRMWEIVPDENYVANPAKGSRHNRGAAVDVTLVDAKGRELEMPTGYDDFTPAAHRDFAGASPGAQRNRAILEEAMESEGFIGLRTEWWHFDDPEWERYPILDVPLTEVP